MSNTPSNLPPPTAGVMTISRSIMINAPRQKVWDTLLDLSKYPEWNPFVFSLVAADASKKPLPEQEQKAVEGRWLLMSVHLSPTLDTTASKTSQIEFITHVDHTAFRIAWVYKSLPSWLLNAERWQALSKVDGQTLYETREVFGGPLAYLVKLFVKSKLEAGFEAMAEALKTRTEQ